MKQVYLLEYSIDFSVCTILRLTEPSRVTQPVRIRSCGSCPVKWNYRKRGLWWRNLSVARRQIKVARRRGREYFYAEREVLLPGRSRFLWATLREKVSWLSSRQRRDKLNESLKSSRSPYETIATMRCKARRYRVGRYYGSYYGAGCFHSREIFSRDGRALLHEAFLPLLRVFSVRSSFSARSSRQEVWLTPNSHVLCREIPMISSTISDAHAAARCNAWTLPLTLLLSFLLSKLKTEIVNEANQNISKEPPHPNCSICSVNNEMRKNNR